MCLKVLQITIITVKFMYKYLLKNKSGEVLNTTKQKSLDLSIEYFSKMKLISKKDIFRIYIIEKV